MRKNDHIGWIALAVLVLVLGPAARGGSAGAAYPNKPINVIVAWPVGGGADLATRAISKFAAKGLGQNINIINVTGGNGAIGYRQAATARPDGYTLMNLQFDIWSLEALKTAPISRSDFVPIMAMAYQPCGFVSRTDSPWKTFQEFVAKAKADPGKYNVGGSPIGGVFHQAAMLMSDAARIRFNYVPTGGSPETLAAIVGGHVDTAFMWLSNAQSYMKAGQLRGLAVFADQRSKQFPDVPTLKEQGVDLTYGGFYGIGAPKGTPPDVIATLEKALTQAFQDPEFQAELQKIKLEPMFLNSEEFKGFLEKGYERVVEAVKLTRPAK